MNIWTIKHIVTFEIIAIIQENIQVLRTGMAYKIHGLILKYMSYF